MLNKKTIIGGVPICSILYLIFFQEDSMIRSSLFVLQFFLLLIFILKTLSKPLNVNYIIFGLFIFGAILFYLFISLNINLKIHWLSIYSLILSFYYLIYIKNYPLYAAQILPPILLIFCIYIIILHSFNFVLNLSIRDQNLISMITIPIFFLIILIDRSFKFFNTKSILFLGVIVFITSLLSIGRSGILSSAILLVVSIFYFIKFDYGLKFIGRRISIIIILCFLLLMTFTLVVIIRDNFDALNYFVLKGFGDEDRADILNEFIKDLNFMNILFGDYNGALSGAPTVSLLGGNFHNTYLDMIAKFGFFAALIFIAIFIKLFKIDALILLASIAVYLRFGTDTGNNFFTYISIFSILFFGSYSRLLYQK
jgi:hypothetical protein